MNAPSYLRGLAVLALLAVVPLKANTIYFHGFVTEVTTHYSGGPGTLAWAVPPPSPPVSVGSPILVFLTLPDSAPTPGRGYFGLGCSSGDWSLRLSDLYYPSYQYTAFTAQMGVSIQQIGAGWANATFSATDRNNDPHAWWTFRAAVTVPDTSHAAVLVLASLLGLIACRHRLRAG